MRPGFLFRVFFIIYCLEAGIFLLFAPWSPGWDRTVLQLPFWGLRTLLLHPVARGGVSGFGLVHLVWGAHDLQGLLSRRRRSAEEARDADATGVANVSDPGL